MKVCEKVESKGRTTYNEVADELVTEFTDPNNNPGSQDQSGNLQEAESNYGLKLTFLIWKQTRPHATVEVEISEDMQLVHFDFNR
ncbi:hypothetical protein BHE74_00044468 [Ensete ventricosum]|nr:hypothetical protein GW17_00019715 [Ensete ventricosum]RWW49384.1 hypothetical protein BHE74_00044468 [Ensete ventricosum]RZS14149.1 hypothetical protein BHM03_00045814 [Ensete ventricosum]